MNESGKVHALLSTARIANVPSVVCNVWVGVVLGLAFGAADASVAARRLLSAGGP